MYAIVEIAGQQFKVQKDQKVFVNRLPGKEGDNISFDKVLLTGDGDDFTLGAPAIEGASVGAKITRHLKGDKVVVFKKKRRKGYRKKNGHRQALTEILINELSIKGQKAAKDTTSAKDSENSSKTKEKPAAETKAATPSDKDDLSSHTVAELKEIAKEKGLEGYSALKKAELIELIEKSNA